MRARSGSIVEAASELLPIFDTEFGLAHVSWAGAAAAAALAAASSHHRDEFDCHCLYVGSAHPPHTHGNVQSAVSGALSGRYLLQTEALIGLIDRHTTSNVPAGLSLPIIAGLERWRLVFITTSKPLGAGSSAAGRGAGRGDEGPPHRL